MAMTNDRCQQQTPKPGNVRHYDHKGTPQGTENHSDVQAWVLVKLARELQAVRFDRRKDSLSLSGLLGVVFEDRNC